MSLRVATDGACSPNPGPTGWAWVSEDGRWASGSLRDGTNNVGELLAVLNAIRDHSDVAELTLLVDSQYAINTYTTWMDAHERRGWRTAAGKPVANVDILEDMMAARSTRRGRGLPDVQFEWVRGHVGHPLNERADTLAVEASRRAARGIETEPYWSD